MQSVMLRLAYQVRQVLAAIARLEAEKNEEGDDDA
jgi:hypothetical protein